MSTLTQLFAKKLEQYSDLSQGFTLIEVIVGVLIMTLSLTTALNLTVYAVALRLKAKQYSEAVAWIQEDLENRKFQAFSLDYSTSTSSYTPDPSACSATSLNSGYADRLRDAIIGTNGNNTSTFTIPKTATNGQAFNVVGSLTPSSSSPYNILQVSYTVTPTSGGSSVATLQTEVIPDAALICP